MTVADLPLQQVPTVDLCVAAAEGVHEMRKCHTSALVVLDRSLPLGVITEQDLAPIAESPEVTVGDVIGCQNFVLRRDQDAGQAMRRMQAQGIRLAPVVNRRGKLFGLFALNTAAQPLEPEAQTR